jgi:hypothetical protein
MKFNKWTLGLAAVGAVSMASAVRADEKLVPLETAVSSTTISGYVDVAAQYNPGDPGGTFAANQPPTSANAANSASKVDAFTLNDIDIALDKALDESPWASGYHVELNWGLDAIGNIPGASIVRQGYVTMRTPVGNGIDWKFGAFDGVTGYESNTGYANPNYTRSYGYQLNPQTELGLLGSYKIVDGVAIQLGMGDRGYGSGVPVGLSSKNYIGAIALTAPDSWGFLKGSVLNFGTVQTFDNGGVNNYSANATIATPVTGLKVGVAYDVSQNLITGDANAKAFGLYGTYQATDKLAFNLRGEATRADQLFTAVPGWVPGQGYELTATIEYDMWANMVSRLEFRWDHVQHGVAYNNGSGDGVTPSDANAFLLALNLVYKF